MSQFKMKVILFLLICFIIGMYCNGHDHYSTSKGWVSDRPDPNRDMWNSGSSYHDEFEDPYEYED